MATRASYSGRLVADGITARQVADAVGEALAGLGVRHVFGVIGCGNFRSPPLLSGTGHVPRRPPRGRGDLDGRRLRAGPGRRRLLRPPGPGVHEHVDGAHGGGQEPHAAAGGGGETPAAALRSNFRVDQAGIVAAVGAIPERIHSGRAPARRVRAYRRAVVERRPVVLKMPLDVQAAADPRHAAARAAARSRRPARSPGSPRRTIRCGRRAPAHPRGPRRGLAGAAEPLEALGERARRGARDLGDRPRAVRRQPVGVGISGGFASPLAAELIAESDLVLACGAG